MKLELAGQTDIGRLRDQNEDSLLVLSDLGVIAVADGLGGHRSGALASQLALATLSDFFMITVASEGTWPFPYDEALSDEENYLFTGVRLANRRIFDRSLKNLADFGMGTTTVAGMFARDCSKLTLANVGDSRGYRIREGKIEQLTRDHSLLSDAVTLAPWMTPEEISQLPPNVVTRALGIREEVDIDVTVETTAPGDIYLLCSDGLSSIASDEEILEVILDEQRDLGRASELLVRLANDYGGPDNITVALAALRG